LGKFLKEDMLKSPRAILSQWVFAEAIQPYH